MQNVFPYIATISLFSQDSLQNYVPVKEKTRYDIHITSDTIITDSLYFFIMRDIKIFEKKKLFK
jgi:hypothetical protein